LVNVKSKLKGDMRRIAIIDHYSHELMVEDIDEKELEEKYEGNEQAYIHDNYELEGDYSWDWITDAQYFKNGESDPIEIDFSEIGDI
jgi:hypothetical protein